MAEYCDLGFFKNACPPDVFSATSSAEQTQEIKSASNLADFYLGQIVELPLTQVGQLLPAKVAEVAVFQLAAKKNLAGSTTDYPPYVLYKEALNWLKGLNLKSVEAAGIVGTSVTPTPDVVESPESYSSPQSFDVEF